MEKSKNRKKTKGITLVALVVTIVVLIILATISINIIFGEEGIVERAKQAKHHMANAEAEEQQILAESSNSMEQHIKGERETVTIDKEEYDALVKRVEDLEKNKLEIQTGSFTVDTFPASRGVNVDITFTNEMADTNYSFNIVTSVGAAGWANMEFLVKNKTTTGCRVRVFNNSSAEYNGIGYEWSVIGKLKE